MHCLALRAAEAGKGWGPWEQACPGHRRWEGLLGRGVAALGTVLQAGCTHVDPGCRGQPAFKALGGTCCCQAGLQADACGLSQDCRVIWLH